MKIIYISADGENTEQVINNDGNPVISVFLDNNSKNTIPNTQYDGVIFQLKNEPITKKYSQLKSQQTEKVNIQNEIFAQKQLIEQEHTAVKQEIKNKYVDSIVTSEFSKAFNGILVKGVDLQQARELVEENEEIIAVFPNYEVKATLMDSVSLINADDVWDLGYTGQGVTIAIIDTGVDYTHEDLGGCIGAGCKVIGGYDFVNDDDDPMDDHGHGTHVAATAAGNGVLKGVAPDATIYAYKVLDSGGIGWSDWLIGGIEAATDPNNDDDFSDHLNILSMSLGGSGNPDDPMSQAVDNAVDIGVVAVIAAGNNGPGERVISSPGTARKAITVGATDKNDNIASFSSRGPVVWNDEVLIKPDLTAPGVSICAAEWDSAWADKRCLDEEHVAISGTSMATPHVAGAAALLLQAHPDWEPETIKSALMISAKDLNYNSTIQGTGRIDVYKANNISFTTNPQSIALFIANESKTQDIVIKNLQSYEINISLSVDNENMEITPFVTIPANSEATVTVSVSSPEYGEYQGEIYLFYNDEEYHIPYLLFRYINFVLSIESENHIMPYYFQLLTNYSKHISMDFNLRENKKSTTFLVKPGNYIGLIVGDIDNFSLYYLAEKYFEVPDGISYYNATINLENDTIPYTFKAEDFHGNPLNLVTYMYGRYINYTSGSNETKTESVISGLINFYSLGNRTIYISPKPTDNFNRNIAVFFHGTPSTTNEQGCDFYPCPYPPPEINHEIYNNYAAAEEEYVLGYVVNETHINKTSYDYDFPSEFQIEKIDYGLPGEKPYYYGSSTRLSLKLGSKNFLNIIWMRDIFPPLNRTYYKKIADPKYHMFNISFVSINYIKGDGCYNYGCNQPFIDSSVKEVINNNYIEKYKAGNPPYRPGGIVVYSDFGFKMIKFDDKILRNIDNSSFVTRETNVRDWYGNIIYVIEEKPNYQIYRNGMMMVNTTLTSLDDSEGWNPDRLNTILNIGNMTINITIPTHYLLYNITKISAEIQNQQDYSVAQIQPPILNYIDIKPSFVYDVPLEIKADITDNIQVASVQMFYKYDNNWIEIPLQNNQPLYHGVVTINEASNIEKLDIKVITIDSDGNKISYEFLPASVRQRRITLNFENQGPFSSGDTVKISGSCTDEKGLNCSFLRAEYKKDGNFFRYDPAEGFLWKIPEDASGSTEFSVSVQEAGIYARASTNFSVLVYGTCSGLLGDINKNGCIDRNDLEMIGAMVYQGAPIDWCADINQDGSVDSIDYLTLPVDSCIDCTHLNTCVNNGTGNPPPTFCDSSNGNLISKCQLCGGCKCPDPATGFCYKCGSWGGCYKWKEPKPIQQAGQGI